MFRPERLRLNPSRSLRRLVLLIHAGAALSPFLSSLPAAASAGLALLVLVHGRWLDGAVVSLRHPGSIVALRWDEQRWWLERQDGREREVVPTVHSVMTARLVLLHYRELASGRRGLVMLFPDSGPADGIRRLRVQLRFSFAGSSRPATRS